MKALTLALALAAALAAPAAAAVYEVPTIAWPTIQSALDDAAKNADATNEIQLNTAEIDVHAPLTLTWPFPKGFHNGRTLVVHPKPGIATLQRVSIVSDLPQNPIVDISGQQAITFEDVDVLRNITNDGDLVHVVDGIDITFDRVRIGLIWPSYGHPGYTMVDLEYPKRLLFRNCIFFSVILDAFATDLKAQSMIDPENSLYVYNTLFADYRDHGLFVQAGPTGQTVALRNDVFINDPDYAVVNEPTAVESHVAAGVTVLSSHNSVFTDGFKVEDQFDAQPLMLVTTSDFLRLFRADAAPSFQSMDWTPVGGWAPNATLYHLIASGPLHVPGVTMPASTLDYPVNEDIDRDPRPSGATPHTDRGPDQVDPRVDAVGDHLAGGWVMRARRSPGPSPSLEYSAPRAGVLAVDVLDVAGRAIYRESRRVSAGETGTIRWSAAAPGAYFYRARLAGDEGEWSASGRCVVVR